MDEDWSSTARHGGDRQGLSRRALLAVGALGLVAAGGGVAVGVATTGVARRADTAPPADLLIAVAAERTLIAEIDSATRANPADGAMLRQVRADHVKHLRALAAAVELATGLPNELSTESPSAAARSGTPPPVTAHIRMLEQQAAMRAAALALKFTGRDAALLASIAASEASHVELLS